LEAELIVMSPSAYLNQNKWGENNRQHDRRPLHYPDHRPTGPDIKKLRDKFVLLASNGAVYKKTSSLISTTALSGTRIFAPVVVSH